MNVELNLSGDKLTIEVDEFEAELLKSMMFYLSLPDHGDNITLEEFQLAKKLDKELSHYLMGE